MVMAVAAAEATVGLAIVIAIYRNKKTPLVDEYDAMQPMNAGEPLIPLLVVLPMAGFLRDGASSGGGSGKQAHWIPVAARSSRVWVIAMALVVTAC